MNLNLFIWTSDWHVVSNDSESGVVGETRPSDAGNVSAHIVSLDPAGVIDTGDCREHMEASGDELDRYIEHVQDVLPWAEVNSGGNAEYPILPGNHDERYGYNEAGQTTDFSPFDDKFWEAPYRWTCDWAAPRIRFIAFHSYIHHSQDGLAGFFHVDESERDWLELELDDLPAADWQAIVCSHAPGNPDFGNEIRSDMGGTELREILAENSERICAYLNGHRHENMGTDVLDDITHFNGPGMAYSQGNSRGGWVPITYDHAARTLTFDFLLGPPGAYTRKVGYTPVVIQLSDLIPSFTFAADGGALASGSAVALANGVRAVA